MQKHSDTIDFACACGKQVRARIDQGGRPFCCPDCGAKMQVPVVTLRPGATGNGIAGAGRPTPPDQIPVHGHHVAAAPVGGRSLLKVPTSTREMSLYIAASWAAASVVCLFVSLFSTIAAVIALLLFLTVTGGAVYQLYLLMRARQRVLTAKDIPLLWGFVRLVAWDPVEGVLFLRNKAMGFADDCLHDGQGGVRFTYPILGDELALRVPLEVQTLNFCDANVLTREYLSVTVSGTLKWRIVDIRKFYLLLSQELRSTADHVHRAPTEFKNDQEVRERISNEERAATSMARRVDLAITWLRVLTEEQTRFAISRVSSGLLIADRLANEVPEIRAAAEGTPGTRDTSLLTALASAPPQAATPEWSGTADGLARSIFDTLRARVDQYGILVEDVSLREIRLPDEIVAECVRAAKAAYLPLLAQRQAAADVAVKRATLAAEVELLGREAVAAREVVGAAPAFTLADFLNDFVRKGLNPQAAAGLAATAATAGLIGAPLAAMAPALEGPAPAANLPPEPVPAQLSDGAIPESPRPKKKRKTRPPA